MMLKQIKLNRAAKQIHLPPVHNKLPLPASPANQLPTAGIANATKNTGRVRQLAVAATAARNHAQDLIIPAAIKPPT